MNVNQNLFYLTWSTVLFSKDNRSPSQWLSFVTACLPSVVTFFYEKQLLGLLIDAASFVSWWRGELPYSSLNYLQIHECFSVCTINCLNQHWIILWAFINFGKTKMLSGTCSWKWVKWCAFSFAPWFTFTVPLQCYSEWL